MNTTIQYKNLDDAYKYLNDKLFDGKLPDVFITMNAKGRSAGYHHHEKYINKENGLRISEIAFNPVTFQDQSDIEILSTLLHEMCHHWQYSFSEPARKGYHDREWAEKMKEVGLQPTSTGQAGGKETGQSMSDMIIEGGKFEIVAGAFLLDGTKIIVSAVPDVKKERQKSKTREKYVCPTCHVNIWAKKDLNIRCGDCGEKFVIEEES